MSLVRRVCSLVVLLVLAAPTAVSPSEAAAASRSRAYAYAPSRPVGAQATIRGTSPYPLSSDRHTLGRISTREAAAGPMAPVSGLHFEAIPRIGANWPADPTGAMGNDWFFAAVNISYALYDLTGTAVLSPAPLKQFFTYPAGTQVFDPKVVYDEYGQTFVLVFLAADDGLRKSWINIVTIPDATANDTTTWCARRFNGDQVAGNRKQWADYPGLGYDLDRVAVTTNEFNYDRRQSFAYSQIMSFPKSSLYDCTQAVPFDVFAGPETQNPDKTPAFTIQPTSSVGANPSDQYLVSFERRRSGSFLVLWRLREASTGASLARTALSVPPVTTAPYGTQGGGSLNNPDTWWDGGDLRIVSAFYDADLGKVYAAHAVARNLRPDPDVPGGYLESAIRWYEVQPAARLADTVVTRIGIIGTPETDAGWPAIATDSLGNVFVTYSRASQPRKEFLSAWAAEIPPGSTTATIAELAPGTARMEAISGRPERWGDFNAACRDPLDPTKVVLVNQYAKSDGVGPTKDWQQTFDLVSDVVPSPSPSPSPTP